MSRVGDRIAKVSVTDEVADRIRTMIRSGEVAVGQKLPTEMELRERFGVGRSTVREALRALQAIGLVELRPGTGAFVAAPTDSMEAIRTWFIEKETELDEFMEVRMAIEPVAVRLAAARATEAEIDEIDAIHGDFVDAIEEGDAMSLAKLDEAFHTAIVEASHNTMLAKMHGLVTDALRDYRIRSFAVAENVRNALGPHRSILEALRSGDSESGVAAMHEHLVISLDDIRRVAHDV